MGSLGRCVGGVNILYYHIERNSYHYIVNMKSLTGRGGAKWVSRYNDDILICIYAYIKTQSVC